MTATRATRWGCVGPGQISSDFFLAIQDNLPQADHEFVSVASKDKDRAQAFAEKFGFKRSYNSYDDVAEDTDVEIVYIGTLHTSHAELAIKMLKAGKHVLCEKPMAMNCALAKTVLKEAKKQNKFFMEGIWSRCFPVYEQIRKDLAANSLGDPRLVQATFCKQNAHKERNKRVDLGGGGLLNIGIYIVQFACLVFKEMPQSITVIGNMLGDVDESACIIFKYENGAMANLTYHTNAGVANNTAMILGQNGRIEVVDPFHCPTTCTSPSGQYTFPLKDNQYNYGNGAGMHYEATEARRCIVNGFTESPLYSHADSEMVHTIMDEIRKQIGMKYPDFD